MIKQLAHLCIHSNNLTGTKNFYCDLLGLEQKFKFYKENELFGFYVHFGNNTFVEFFYNPDVILQDSPINHFCIEVTQIDQMIAKLNENGYKTTEKKLGVDNSWQTWATDPNGIKIELHEYTKESSQFTGTDCEVDW